MYADFSTRGVLCLIRHPKDMRRAYPITVIPRLPVAVFRVVRQVPAWFRVQVSLYVPKYPYTLLQPFFTDRSQWGFPRSRPISSCMPWPVDSGGSIHPRQLRMESCCLRDPLDPRHPQHPSFEAVPALKGTRFPLRPTEFSVYASPVLFAAILHDSATGARLDTERMANPSPTGTFTLLDTPDFAWRETPIRLTGRWGLFPAVRSCRLLGLRCFRR